MYFRITTQEFSIVGGYMEGLKKTHKTSGGVGACVGMGACPGQYSIGSSPRAAEPEGGGGG